MSDPRLQAYALLALTNLFWASNWVVARALHASLPPVALNFWRWAVAVAVLAPFALPGLLRNGPLVRRHWRLIVALGLTGITFQQSMVYQGLQTTTMVNAVLLNSSVPMFVLACAWIMEGETASPRQLFGMAVSIVGIVVILGHGTLDGILDLRFNAGDAWILAALPLWGVYSVLVKRKPPELGGVPLMFLIALTGLLSLVPALIVEASVGRRIAWRPDLVLAVIWIGVTASALGFVLWNRAVQVVGASVAGFSMHLLPAFGTILAIVVLGETLHGFHVVGVALILGGVLLATLRPAR